MPDPERRVIEVALPAGPTTVSALWTPPVDGTVVIVAHGAGAGMEHPFLTGFAEALAAEGFGTLRFNFPYVEQGRRMPGPAAHATATWRAVVDAVREAAPGARIIATGKSYGGRMASMAVADGLAIDALAYLGYPLHPPGAPEKLRAEHLPGIAVPQLFVEGSNDPFIQPREQFDEVVAGCRDARVVWIEGGGHSFEVKGRKVGASEVGASLAPIVAEFAAAR
ncbi:alpha/beta fold hydrolase [uncultured Microbacterium sp.]|uniref:alpha/beta hydrolase family protein n=1 Tax=uncultured Microbacterium sp. TaxID=191216 RepID=UPI0028DB7963|nr:alpha/beta fold hydrolase [uncultured Microbacterium sp.]